MHARAGVCRLSRSPRPCVRVARSRPVWVQGDPRRLDPLISSHDQKTWRRLKSSRQGISRNELARSVLPSPDKPGVRLNGGHI